MRLFRLLPLVALVACKPTPSLPERLVLTASDVRLDWGEEQVVSAHAFIGTKAQNVDGLTWESADETIATVVSAADGSATLEGVGAGSTRITARLREATAELTVTVAARVLVLQRIAVTGEMSSVPRGLMLQLTATGHYDDGSTRDLTSTCAWASADSTKATVNHLGLVTGVDVGAVDLRALKSGVTGTLGITVTAATLSAIDVRPASTSLALGTTQLFTATGRFSDASSRSLTAMATWASSDDTIVSVDGTGRGVALKLGMAEVRASFMGVSGTAQVTVTDATLRALEATPSAFNLPLGSSRAVTLQGRYSDGTFQDLTSMAAWRSGTPGVASVDDAGVVTAVGQGLSVITASVGAISTTSSVTCTAPQLQTIRVAPQAPSVPLGLTQTLTATGVYTDATTRDLTQAVTWSSSDAGVAVISNLAGENGLVNTVSEGVVVVTASNGTLSGSTTLTVAPPLLLSLQIDPAQVNLPAGLSRQLTATGSFSDTSTRDLTSQVTWSSQFSGVATVSNDAGVEGLVTAIAVGSTSVDATLGLVTASRVVVVSAPVLQRIDVTAAVSSVAKGRTLQLQAMGTYTDGTQQNLTSTATWTSSSGTTLSVSAAGLASALQVGAATATATFGSVSGALPLTVTAAEVDALTLSPSAPSVALGLGVQLTVQATYSDGTVAPLSTGLTWSVADPLIASVANGAVSTLAEGQTVVTATIGSVQGSVTVQVLPPVLTAIALTPSAAFALDKTQTQTVTAEGTLSNGQRLDVTSTATWTSSAPGVATVSSTGLVTAVSPGAATISATQASVSGSVGMTVNRPALASLAVTPVNAHVNRGRTLSFVATATYVDMSTEVVTSLATWTSSDTSVATIASTGVATGVTVGSTTLTASWNGQSDSTGLTVDPVPLVSIAVTGPGTVAAGTAVPLVATGLYDDATTADVTALVTWASASPTTVAFSNLTGVFGVAQGLSSGNTTVTATLGAIVSPAFPVSVLATNPPYAGRCAPGLVISQVYGGGGNSGATLRNDFVELHNPTGAPISLSGLSLQYTSATGTSWGSNLLVLDATKSVPAGGYFLVMLASGGAAGTVFSGDQTGTIQMSGTAGKVLLASVTTGLSGTCPTANVLDLIGYGTTADCFEGTRAPAPSNTSAIVRGVSGCRDANQSGSDFSATASGSITPRSLASGGVLCSCSANGLGTSPELNACQLLSPSSLTVNAAQVSAPVSASVTQPGVTELSGFDPSLRVQVGFGPVSVSPATGAGWQWWPTTATSAGMTADAYDGVFVAPASGSWAFTSRASLDGVNWTSCDLNGAGSGGGLALELGQLGALTVP